MLAVLALIVTVAPVASLGTARLREEIDYATTDIAATRLRWAADGCIAQGAALLDSMVASVGTEAQAMGGGMTRILRGERGTSCRLLITREPAWAASLVPLEPDSLRTLLATAALPVVVRDSLTDALADWQDADTVCRGAGAERTWYASADRLPPRNAPIAAIEELALVRGLEAEIRRAEVLAALQRQAPNCESFADGVAPPPLTRGATPVPRTIAPPGACRAVRISATAMDRSGVSVAVTAVVQPSGRRTAFIELRREP